MKEEYEFFEVPGSPSQANGRHGSDSEESNYDKRDMQRLGKKQEFKRNFRLISAFGFVSVYMATWEFVLVSLSVGFTNGG